MNKCSMIDCNKKIKLHLVNYPCKCNLIFCELHRLPENHMCCYFYNDDGTRKIIETTVVIDCNKKHRLESVE